MFLTKTLQFDFGRTKSTASFPAQERIGDRQALIYHHAHSPLLQMRLMLRKFQDNKSVVGHLRSSCGKAKTDEIGAGKRQKQYIVMMELKALRRRALAPTINQPHQITPFYRSFFLSTWAHPLLDVCRCNRHGGYCISVC
jgi:hypothetical protein